MGRGFASLLLLLFVPLVLGVLFLIMVGSSPLSKVTSPIETFEVAKEKLSGISGSRDVFWEWDHNAKKWQSLGAPPDCPKTIIFPSPVDVSLASGILYPGQTRGGDYKPHGGFRFDNLPSNSVDVYAPMDGKLHQASRHWAMGEVQYVLYFVNDCGISYKLDHLLVVTDKFQKIFEDIPMGGENDSRTTQVNPQVFVAKGEHVATKVGFEKSKNVFFDFGVYDLRSKNGVDYSRRNYYNVEQYAEHAICWFDNLEEPARGIVKNLPGADSENGKKSDYCK